MQAPWRTCSESFYMHHEFSHDSSPASAVPADILTSSSSDFLEHIPLLNFKWPCSGSWNPKQSSPFTTSPLKAILTPPPTLRTARIILFYFFPMPVGDRREVLMTPLSATIASLHCTKLNDTAVAFGVSRFEWASVLPLLKHRQSGSRFFHPVFQNFIHESTLVLQFQ